MLNFMFQLHNMLTETSKRQEKGTSLFALNIQLNCSFSVIPLSTPPVAVHTAVFVTCYGIVWGTAYCQYHTLEHFIEKKMEIAVRP